MTPRIREWGAIVALALALLGGAVAWGSLQKGYSDLKAEVGTKAEAGIVQTHQDAVLRELTHIEERLDRIEERLARPSR